MYVNFSLVMAVINTAISVIATIFGNVTKSSMPGDTPILIFHGFFPSQFELIYPFNLILAWPVGQFKTLDQ